MTDNPRASEYATRFTEGAFPGRIDPWAEAVRFFQQIHGGMISALLAQLQLSLMERGYYAGCLESIQEAARHGPDLFGERKLPNAVHVFHEGSGELITVVEIISPQTKADSEAVQEYRSQRDAQFLQQGMNVVEIDATRSVMRSLEHPLTANHPYHIAIYLPGQPVRVIVSTFEEPLKRFALPLRGEIIPVDTQDAYHRGYRNGGIAPQIAARKGYAETDLPFPRC